MEFIKDPVKAKRAFIAVFVIGLIFILATIGMGFLYWQKSSAYKDLKGEKEKLEATKKTKTLTEKELQEKVTTLEKQVTDLQAADKQEKAAVKAYLEVLNYMALLVERHGGFDGWTEAEFQEGRRLAVATGNSSYVASIDYCWGRTDIPQMTRLVKFLRDTVTAINNALE